VRAALATFTTRRTLAAALALRRRVLRGGATGRILRDALGVGEGGESGEQEAGNEGG
jgi:hypothetical protein